MGRRRYRTPPERSISRTSPSFASKILGTNVCGFQSYSGNADDCTYNDPVPRQKCVIHRGYRKPEKQRLIWRERLRVLKAGSVPAATNIERGRQLVGGARNVCVVEVTAGLCDFMERARGIEPTSEGPQATEYTGLPHSFRVHLRRTSGMRPPRPSPSRWFLHGHGCRPMWFARFAALIGEFMPHRRQHCAELNRSSLGYQAWD